MKKTSVRILAVLLVFALLFFFVACDKAVEEPNETPSETTAQREEVKMVWIVTTGEKYHKRASCSNMKYPKKVSLEEAERRGYDPCKKCY